MRASNLKKGLTVFFGSLPFLLLSVPAAAFLASGATKNEAPGWFHVAEVSSLAADGTPRRFTVREQRIDTWTVHEGDAVGQVFLRLAPETGEVVALTATHPSSIAPIEVRYDDSAKIYASRCRGCKFDLNGKLLNRERDQAVCEDMERLKVEVVRGAVFVELPPKHRR